MLNEITIAVAFVVRMLSKSVTEETRRAFSVSLSGVMQERYLQAAWDPLRPILGSAYRCLRSEAGRIDPVLLRAATQAGLPHNELPCSLTLWVDPGDVSARIGAEGSLFRVTDSNNSASHTPAVATTPSSPGKLSPTTPARTKGLRSLAITERPSATSPTSAAQQQQQQQQQQTLRMPIGVLA